MLSIISVNDQLNEQQKYDSGFSDLFCRLFGKKIIDSNHSEDITLDNNFRVNYCSDNIISMIQSVFFFSESDCEKYHSDVLVEVIFAVNKQPASLLNGVIGKSDPMNLGEYQGNGSAP